MYVTFGTYGVFHTSVFAINYFTAFETRVRFPMTNLYERVCRECSLFLCYLYALHSTDITFLRHFCYFDKNDRARNRGEIIHAM